MDEKDSVIKDGIELKRCKIEIEHPNREWESMWRTSKIKTMPRDLISFIFKWPHGLLLTWTELHKINRTDNKLCQMGDENVDEDRKHAMLQCKFNENVGAKMIRTIQKIESSLTADDALRLELRGMEEEKEKGVLIFCSAIFSYIWECSYRSNKPRLYEIRSSIEARCCLLRDGRNDVIATHLEKLCNSIKIVYA